MIENLDLLNPKKKYTCKGFEIIPSDYWVEEFLQSLSKISIESRRLLFWDQTNNDLYFDLRSFTRTKGFKFQKQGRAMYWLFNRPKDFYNAWTLDVFNPPDSGINGIDFMKGIPIYFYLVDKFKETLKCKKIRAYVVNDNKQSLRMCQMLVKKGYLELECELKNEVFVHGKDRDLTLFLRSK